MHLVLCPSTNNTIAYRPRASILTILMHLTIHQMHYQTVIAPNVNARLMLVQRSFLIFVSDTLFALTSQRFSILPLCFITSFIITDALKLALPAPYPLQFSVIQRAVTIATPWKTDLIH